MYKAALLAGFLAFAPALVRAASVEARSPVASLPGILLGESGDSFWRDASAAELRAALPGLKSLASQDLTPSVLRAVGRTMAESDLSPEKAASLSASRQELAIRDALTRRIEILLAEKGAGDAGSEADRLVALEERQARLIDARAACAVLSEARAAELSSRLGVEEAVVFARVEAARGAVLDRMLEGARDWDGPTWYGRTAVFESREGSLVALKFPKMPGLPLSQERKGMELSRAAGVRAPIPLGIASRDDTRAKSLMATPLSDAGSPFAYFVPKSVGRDFFSYLGQAFPMPDRLDRVAAVRLAALRSMRDLVRLADHGLIQTSLAPISHSGTRWDWDFWRFNVSFCGVTFGPTSIHDWGKALDHANLRLSGIADFEHIEPPREQALLGQNLTEWSLLVMRAGVFNGLTVAETAAILLKGFQHHAFGLVDASSFDMDWKILERLLRSSTRRFYRFAATARWMPRPLIALRNEFIGRNSNQRIERGAALVLSGVVLRGHIFDVVYPYITAASGRIPKKWGHLELYQKMRVTRPWQLALAFALGVLGDFQLIFFFIFGMAVSIAGMVATMTNMPWTLFFSSGFLIMAALRLPLALYGLLRRAARPLWIREKRKARR